MIRFFTCTCFLIVLSFCAKAQSGNPIVQLTNFLNGKITKTKDQLDKQSKRWLNKLKAEEQRLYKKMVRRDSAAASALFGNIAARYDSLKHLSDDSTLTVYDGDADSIITAARFSRESRLQISANLLKEKLNISNHIKKKLAERKQVLMQSVSGKALQRFKKSSYYYSQQLSDLKSFLTDRTKREEKIWKLVRDSKRFKDFFEKHSQFATLFPRPNVIDPTMQNGLQTRAYVNNLIERRRMSFPSLNPQVSVSQNLDAAASQLNELKGKLLQKNDAANMPDFKPNSQKTKSFLKRLEFGFNFQSQPGKQPLPSRTAMGLSVGYKPNDRSVIGFGASYIAGWGSGWRNIKLTHEGIGIRTFVDLKLKGSLWMTAGYEKNYMQAFTRFAAIDDWQQSALIGISKKIKVNKRKALQAQLLYDLLNKNNTKQGQRLIYRVGWSFAQ